MMNFNGISKKKHILIIALTSMSLKTNHTARLRGSGMRNRFYFIFGCKKCVAAS